MDYTNFIEKLKSLSTKQQDIAYYLFNYATWDCRDLTPLTNTEKKKFSTYEISVQMSIFLRNQTKWILTTDDGYSYGIFKNYAVACDSENLIKVLDGEFHNLPFYFLEKEYENGESFESMTEFLADKYQFDLEQAINDYKQLCSEFNFQNKSINLYSNLLKQLAPQYESQLKKFAQSL